MLTGFKGRTGRMISSDANNAGSSRLPPANIATTLAALTLSQIPLQSYATHAPLQSYTTPRSPQPPTPTHTYSTVHASGGPVVQNTPWPGPYQPPHGAGGHSQICYSPLPAAAAPAAPAMMSPSVFAGMSHQHLQSPTPRVSAWSPSVPMQSAGGSSYRHAHTSPSPSPAKGAHTWEEPGW